MKKIAIIGGTGMTGQCVVDYALQKGLGVRLLYRNETTVPDSFKNKVDLVKGDATNLDDVRNLLQDVEAVAIVLGTRNDLAPTTALSTATQNIVTAMKEKNLRIFSIVMSSFLFMDEDKRPKIFENLNVEHKRMRDIAVESGLDYIAIHPPHIADEPSSEVTVLHDKSPGRVISKYDLAKFIIDSLEQPEHYGKFCGIAKKIAA